MGYLPDATIEKLRRSVKFGHYFHLATSPPLRLWSGPASIEQTLPGVDDTPEVYSGVRLLSLVEMDAILNGGAERYQFSLEGVSADSAEKIAGTDPDVVGKRLYVGIAVHDDDWQAITPIYPLNTGTADYWGMSQPAGSATRTLFLSAGFGEPGRKRPRRIVYSDAQQKFLFPGDDFCRDVVRYHRGFVCTWPRF